MRISTVELMRRIRDKLNEETAGMTHEEYAERSRQAAERSKIRAECEQAELAIETAGMTAEEASAYSHAKSQASWEALVKETEGMTEDEAYAHIIASGEQESAEWWARHQAEGGAGGQARPPAAAPAEFRD